MKCKFCNVELEEYIDDESHRRKYLDYLWCPKCGLMYQYIQDKTTCQTCGNDKGEPREDNGLACGVHCDDCFEEMISKCRSRSW